MAEWLERLSTEWATRDRFLVPVKCFFLFFFFLFYFFGYPSWGVINPGYLVIEVLMQKTLFHHLVEGYTYKSCEYLLRYTSKLMIYGFLNFFCVSEGGPPETRVRWG
jgi:hypothetical protein